MSQLCFIPVITKYHTLYKKPYLDALLDKRTVVAMRRKGTKTDIKKYAQTKIENDEGFSVNIFCESYVHIVREFLKSNVC